MDRVKNNKEALRKYLKSWVQYHPDEQTGIPLTIVEDAESGHFLLFEMGFGKEGWVHTLFVHFRILDDGRIILLENNTEEVPFDELEEYGILKNDLAIAWSTPEIFPSLLKGAA